MIALQRFYRGNVPGAWILFAEGGFVAALGAVASGTLFPEHATIVSLFLASLLADDSLRRLLDWNRESIVGGSLTAVRANGWLTLKLLALFLGAFVAYATFASALPWSKVNLMFALQTGPHHPLFPLMHFGSFPDLVLHNLGVMLFFFAVALPFRQGGVLLAITWNASVWGGTVACLARYWSEHGGPWLPMALLRVAGAILPHLAMECIAYVGAGMAGVFVSRAAEKHKLGSDSMFEVLESVLLLLGGMTAFVVIGALWEAHVARVLVRLVS